MPAQDSILSATGPSLLRRDFHPQVNTRLVAHPLSYLADHTGTAHDRFNDRMSADVGYAHLWVDDSRINRTELTTGTLAGNYKSDVDIFSVQFNYQFD